MRVFKTEWFVRFARKENIQDGALREAVRRAENGQVDADLGGCVLKQRIARPGRGKAKGYRAIIIIRKGGKAFFVYGFAKSDRANISNDEKAMFKNLPSHLAYQ